MRYAQKARRENPCSPNPANDQQRENSELSYLLTGAGKSDVGDMKSETDRNLDSIVTVGCVLICVFSALAAAFTLWITCL